MAATVFTFHEVKRFVTSLNTNDIPTTYALARKLFACSSGTIREVLLAGSTLDGYTDRSVMRVLMRYTVEDECINKVYSMFLEYLRGSRCDHVLMWKMSATSKYGTTLFHAVCEGEDMSKVREVLDLIPYEVIVSREPLLTIQNKRGWTPVHSIVAKPRHYDELTFNYVYSDTHQSPLATIIYISGLPGFEKAVAMKDISTGATIVKLCESYGHREVIQYLNQKFGRVRPQKSSM